MHPEDRKKTAFSTSHGHYEFTRMPFSFKNASATFLRLMDLVLMSLQGEEMFVYLNDVILNARSLRKHEVKYTKLIERLCTANLKLQPDKCEFLKREVIDLGQIIWEDVVKPDPKKLEAVRNFPRPRNTKTIRQFLGLVRYYKRFIPAFSKIAKPLTDVLKKEGAFICNALQDDAFNILRNA